MLNKLVNAAPGSMLKLDDEASLLLSSKNGRGLKPLEYRVLQTLHVTDSLAKWLFLSLKGDFDEVTLMVKIVGEAFDFYRFELSNFPQNNRAVNLGNEQYWLFQEPSGPDWTPNSLKYATAFPEDTEDGKRFNYVIKGQGERTGSAVTKPAITGIGELVATVVEYTTPDEEGREALLLELGSVDSDEGGVISLYIGKRIQPNDLEVYNR